MPEQDLDLHSDNLDKDLNLSSELEPAFPIQTNEKFISVLEKILPHIGNNDEKIISAQIMLALKLEGVIGQDMTERDSQMVQIIKDSIMSSEDKKESALMVAERIIQKLNKK